MARKSNTIKLSKKHGVNPSILHCFICGKETGIALLGKLKGDAEAPMDIYDSHLCKDCQKIIDDGNKFVLEVTDDSTLDKSNRTGRYVAVNGKALTNDVPIAYAKHTVFDKMFGEFMK